MTIAHTLLPLLLIVLAACADTATLPELPTATTVRVIPSTTVPTLARQIQAIATPIPESTVTGTAVACDVAPDGVISRHDVVANLNYARRGVITRQMTTYTNRTDESLPDIVFNIEANQWPGAFTLDTVTLGEDEAVTAYALTGRRLWVELPQPLEPGCTAMINIAFRLDVPQVGNGVHAYKGYFGHTERQFNLGHWLPTVAARIDGTWITRDAVLVGEQTVLEVADWDVTLNVSGASENLVIAAPGVMTRPTERIWRFVLHGSRDFTVSMSEAFAVSRAQAADGTIIELYTYADALVPIDGVNRDGATYALDIATKAVSMFSDLYGQYPYERLLIIEGDFPDGMEFSGLVYVSKDWFTRWPGGAQSYLMLITVHEIAHQWWYGMVGNDAALMPWLDESLATYSEYVFIEEYFPDLREWWWSFRVDQYAPEGFVDANVYQFESIRDYINAVYLRGAHLMHDLRTDLGTEAFFELVRAYAASTTGQIATPDNLWSLMDDTQRADTLATRRHYLQVSGG